MCWRTGEWHGDAEGDKGIQTSPDHRFHTIWAEMPKEVDNTGKDLIVQFSVKHAQKLDCGGGYIKLLPTSRCARGALRHPPWVGALLLEDRGRPVHTTAAPYAA